MRKPSSLFSASICTFFLVANIAHANPLEQQILRHPEFSRFEALLQKTGVNKELNLGVNYTAFVPTDSAIDTLEQSYGASFDTCISSDACKDELANVLRNHIVPQEVSFAEPGLHAVHSIDNFSISLSEPRKGERYVNGKKILNQYGSNLYKIDGTLQDIQERTDLPSAVKKAAKDPESPLYFVDTENNVTAETTKIESADTVVTQRVYYDRNGLVDSRVTTVEPARN